MKSKEELRLNDRRNTYKDLQELMEDWGAWLQNETSDTSCCKAISIMVSEYEDAFVSNHLTNILALFREAKKEVRLLTKHSKDVVEDCEWMGAEETPKIDPKKVKVSTNEYVRSHLREPGGRGSWIFSRTRSLMFADETSYITFNGPYKQARKFAKEQASERGWAVVYVQP